MVKRDNIAHNIANYKVRHRHDDFGANPCTAKDFVPFGNPVAGKEAIGANLPSVPMPFGMDDT